MQTSNMLNAEMAVLISLTAAKKALTAANKVILKVSRTGYLFLLFKRSVS